MNPSKKQELTIKIQNECQKLSAAFVNLSKVFQKLSSYIVNEEETKAEENQTDNSVNEISLGSNELIVKESQENHSKSSTEEPIHLLRRKRVHKRVKMLFGRIITVNCVENNEIIRGYTVHINYRNICLAIGPFKEYDFAITIKKTLLDELGNISCNDTNYEIIITQCFNEIKTEILSKYPPLIKKRDAGVQKLPQKTPIGE